MTRKVQMIIVGIALLIVVGGAYLYLKQSNRVSVSVAQASFEKKEYDKSIETYLKVLENEPANKDALLGLSKAYKEQGEYVKALETLKKLEDGNNPDVEVYLTTADIYIKQGTLARASNYLELVLGKEKETLKRAEIHLQIGTISKKQYDQDVLDEMSSRTLTKEVNSYADKARKNLKKFVELMPNDARVKDVQKDIDSLVNKYYIDIKSEPTNYDMQLICNKLFNPYLNITKILPDSKNGELQLEFYFKPPRKMAPNYRIAMKLYDLNDQIIIHENSKQLTEYLTYDETQNLFTGNKKAVVKIPLERDILERTTHIQLGVAPIDDNFVDLNISKELIETL